MAWILSFGGLVLVVIFTGRVIHHKKKKHKGAFLKMNLEDKNAND